MLSICLRRPVWLYFEEPGAAKSVVCTRQDTEMPTPRLRSSWSVGQYQEGALRPIGAFSTCPVRIAVARILWVVQLRHEFPLLSFQGVSSVAVLCRM